MESNETGVLSNAARQAKFKLNRAFRSLPLDVQRTIDRISSNEEEKSQRTSIALDYQVKFPNSQHRGIDYEAGPVNTSRPGDEGYVCHSGHEEYCEVCDGVLPPLENPRKYPGRCLSCVTGKVGVVG